MILSVPV